MHSENVHLSDEELLLFSDRELSTSQAEKVRDHLSQCPACTKRVHAIERVFTDLADSQDHATESIASPSFALRSSLKARLSESSRLRNKSKQLLFGMLVPNHLIIASCAVVLLAVSAWTLHNLEAGRAPQPPSNAHELLPRRVLTPGMVRAVQAEDLCSTQELENDPPVASSLEEAVFKEYGVSDRSKDSFALDYLIAPDLGGTGDIQNLWPQPSASTSWNAQAKDQLEDLLHTLVCQRKMSLPDAQQELSADWIASYKKHFDTEIPKLDRHARASKSGQMPVSDGLLISGAFVSNPAAGAIPL